MIKPLEQRVRETIGAQAWSLLLQQQQIDELTEKLAEQTKATEAAKAALSPPSTP